MKFNKQTIYIALFAILYLIVAFSSFWHACAFFGLANNSWMSIILAFAFEIGQAAVLFSLLTSKKDRSRVMPWVLMTMFTLVQVIGNVFSSYKYIINNSVENLRFFKEPIFIWTDLPDDQATVIIVYIVGAILPICALLLTSMITNYLSDKEEEKLKALELNKEVINDKNEFNEDNNSLINQNSILQMENQSIKDQEDNLNEEMKKENDSLKEQLNQNEENSKKEIDKINNEKNTYINAFEESDKENKELKEELIKLQDKILELENGRKSEEKSNNNDGSEQQLDRTESEANTKMEDNSSEQNAEGISESIKSIDKNIQLADVLMGGNILKEKNKKPSHFIN